MVFWSVEIEGQLRPVSNTVFKNSMNRNIPGSIWGFLADASFNVSEPAALKTTGPRETVALAFGSNRFAYNERPAPLEADPVVESGIMNVHIF